MPNLMLRRRLQAAAPDQRISILDGVLPSPELGPHPPVPAKTFNSSAANAKVIHEGHYCDDGCIAGSVIGSVAGFAILVAAIFCFWRYWQRRRNGIKGERTLSQIDLLPNGENHAKHSGNGKAAFCAGNPVFCQMGKCCASGAVIDNEGEEYRVRLTDGDEKTVRPVNLAMNYARGQSVVYTPPEGGKSIQGTIVSSNGNYWPPFYQMQPHNSEETINTTAECLAPAKGEDRITEVHASSA